MNIKEYFKKVNIKKIAKQAVDFLYWEISWMLIFLFVLLSLYCVYIWYDYVYNPSWDSRRKEEYIKDKGVGVVFNKQGFDRIVEEKNKRIGNSAKNITNIKDIFRLK